MPTTTVKPANTESVPFFARFLIEQAAEGEGEGEGKGQEQPVPPPIYTLKYPSDWEDR